MYGRLIPVLGLVGLLAVGCGSGSGSSMQPSAPAAKLGGDWTRFGYDAARHDAGPSRTGITSANVRKLKKQRVVLDGTVDASPIYLRGVRVHGYRHDAFFVTTSYGRTVAIDAASGRIAHVWNSLCSNVHRLLNPKSCPQSDSAIWARSGVVVVPGSGNLLVATGNGRFDGSRNWGDSALMLTATASRLLHSWTPGDQASLESGDVDLGSTAPALVGNGLAVQGGKDSKLRLLSLARLGGRLGATNGELQTVGTPGGVFTAPAVWRSRVFVATDSGLVCYVLRGNRLHVSWRKSVGGTSPVVAGGPLSAYHGSLNVYAPPTGKLLPPVSGASSHWNSPIVTDGRVAVPTGDANVPSTHGELDIFRLR